MSTQLSKLLINEIYLFFTLNLVIFIEINKQLQIKIAVWYLSVTSWSVKLSQTLPAVYVHILILTKKTLAFNENKKNASTSKIF